MNHNQWNEFKEIASKIDANYYFLQYSQIKSVYESAVYYNKIQNQFLKDDYDSDIVKMANFYCEIAGEPKTFNIKAYKKYTRKQWFILLFCEQQFKTYQQTKQYLN